MTNAHRLKRGEAQSRGSAEPDWWDEMANAADTPLVNSSTAWMRLRR